MIGFLKSCCVPFSQSSWNCFIKRCTEPAIDFNQISFLSEELFTERMFIYFSRLYAKYRKPIIPIAIFSYDQVIEVPDQFVVRLPFKEILRFQFYSLELRK
jgi:hypothetical protein